MRAYKRMSKSATTALFTAGLIGTGAIASIGFQAFAQEPNTTSGSSAHHQRFNDEGVAQHAHFSDGDDVVIDPMLPTVSSEHTTQKTIEHDPRENRHNQNEFDDVERDDINDFAEEGNETHTSGE